MTIAIKIVPPTAVIKGRDDRGKITSTIVPLDEMEIRDSKGVLQLSPKEYLFEIPKREKTQTILINKTKEYVKNLYAQKRGINQSLHIYLKNQKFKPTKVFKAKPVKIKPQFGKLIKEAEQLGIHPYADNIYMVGLHEVSKEQQTIIKSNNKKSFMSGEVSFDLRIFGMNYTMDKHDFIELQKTINELEGNKITYTKGEITGTLIRINHDLVWTADQLEYYRAQKKLKKESKETSPLERFQQFTKLLANETFDNFRTKYG